VTSEQFASLFVPNYVRAVVMSMNLRSTFAHIFTYVLKHHGYRLWTYGGRICRFFSVKGILWISEVDRK